MKSGTARRAAEVPAALLARGVPADRRDAQALREDAVTPCGPSDSEAEKWILEHMENSEGWGDFPPMVYVLIVFRALGIRTIIQGARGAEAFEGPVHPRRGQ